MTKKIIGTTAALIAALAFAGCSSGTPGDEGANGNNGSVEGTGGVDFNLDLPNGESVSTINLHLSCSGIEQDHVLDVTNGEIIAAFGGLTPGQCTVTMSAETPDGTDCSGSETFTVIADQTTPVTVTLLCQGVNEGDAGRARVGAEFVVSECNTDRIKKIYAIPANVLTGDSTTVEVETWPGTVIGTPTYTFTAVNDPTHTGEGSFSTSASCAATSASCRDFLCTGLGAAPGVDPVSGLPVAGVWIAVTVEDDECKDTEKVWVDCLQASVCGDGNQEGTEECDDHNTANGDGCDSNCELEGCGDGVVQGTEQCDGTTGVGANQHCDATCHLVNDPFCGDNIINGTEQCDGSSLPHVGQTCNASCQIVPVCGNGTQEGTEQCDDSNTTSGDGCSSTCTTEVVVPANECKDCITDASDLDFFTTPCLGDPLCVAVLDCVSSDASNCWVNPSSGASACYCGAGTDPADCELSGFNPATTGAGHPAVGACWSEIKAAAGAGATNADVLARFYDYLNFPSLGNAGSALDFGFTQYCVAECTL